MRFRPIEADAARRRLARAAGVADLRRIARRRLPRGVFDYIDGGAEDERTLDRNTAAYRDIGYAPRVLRDVSHIDTSTTLLGRTLPVPLVLAPTGFTRIVVPAGELAVARAAARADIPYSLSTLATRSIEEVAEVSSARKWFQVYVFKDRGLVADMIERARLAGYEAIMLTADLPVHGRRERDVRHGFELPPKLGLRTLVDGALHPAWTWDFIRAEPVRFANLTGGGIADGSDPVSLAEFITTQFDPSLSWDDLDWIRTLWDGPVVIKGVQSAQDARRAAAEGIDAVVLSNHGGRQLDGAPAPIDLVAEVADSVGGEVEIICDGGIRRGGDIVKAVARGATAAMAGRAYLYGLGAAGEAGVDWVLDLLAADVHRTMALLGVTTVGELDRSVLA